MIEPMRVRWVYSEADERAHVLDENTPAALGFVMTICQQLLPDMTPIYRTAPSMNVCPHCGLYAAVPPPEHPTRPEGSPQDPASPVLSAPCTVPSSRRPVGTANQHTMKQHTMKQHTTIWQDTDDGARSRPPLRLRGG